MRGIHQSTMVLHHKRVVMQNFDVFFGVDLNKMLNKKSISCDSRRRDVHVTFCNEVVDYATW